MAGLGSISLLLHAGPPLPSVILVPWGLGTAWLALRRPRWTPLVLGGNIMALALVSLPGSWLAGPALILALAVASEVDIGARRGRALQREHDRLTDHFAEERERHARQLDRRINQIFSLQELSFVLSESLQEERIVKQVAAYTARFLQAKGAAVMLVDEEHHEIRVVAAEGSLRALVGRRYAESEGGLVATAIGGERLELAGVGGGKRVTLIEGFEVDTAAVAPLRAHGVTMGAIAVSDKLPEEFTTEDLWLLSTVATQTAVVLANSRFFEMFRRGKEEWETTFDALTEGIAIVEGGGRMRRVNRALARLVGLPEPSLVGQSFVAKVFGEDAEGPATIAAACRGERPLPEIVRSETLRRTLRVTAAPLPDGGGECRTVAVLLEDVTEQRALEAQLIQNEKLAAVGQLVSGVAHELNNPLTSIAGLSEFLLEPGRFPESHSEHIRVIHEQAERAGRIVTNLLTFARKGEPETAEVDIHEVVAKVHQLVAHEFTLNQVTFAQQLSAAPAVVRGDQHELQQVLLNLLTNALHAVSDLAPGLIRRITLMTDVTPSEVTIRISDTGAGVPDDVVGQLFTPFFTTKDPGRGTGLGLSISYGVIKSHGGTVVYDPPVDGGAGFLITLPAAAVGPQTTPTGPGTTASRVLVVDSDQTTARIVRALFAPDGHQIEAVETAEDAWQLLAEGEFDLVITDARATLQDGRRLASALRAQGRIPTSHVVITVSDLGRVSDELISSGEFPVVTKPLNLSQVHDLVTMALSRAGSSATQPGEG